MARKSWWEKLLEWYGYFPKPKPDPKPEPPKPDPVPVPPAPDPTPSPKEKPLRYHHYNPRSKHGFGSAIVFCKDQKRFDSVEIAGVQLQRHGNQDKGRDVWATYGVKGLSGKMIARRGEEVYIATFFSSGMQYGTCR